MQSVPGPQQDGFVAGQGSGSDGGLVIWVDGQAEQFAVEWREHRRFAAVNDDGFKPWHEPS